MKERIRRVNWISGFNHSYSKVDSEPFWKNFFLGLFISKPYLLYPNPIFLYAYPSSRNRGNGLGAGEGTGWGQGRERVEGQGRERVGGWGMGDGGWRERVGGWGMASVMEPCGC